MPSKGMTWAELQKTGLGELLSALGMRNDHDRCCERTYSVDARLKAAWGPCKCAERKASPPHILIWKNKVEGDTRYMMWQGVCHKCQGVWQFWHFGASLGYGLEHQRRCGR